MHVEKSTTIEIQFEFKRKSQGVVGTDFVLGRLRQKVSWKVTILFTIFGKLRLITPKIRRKADEIF